MVGLSFWRFPCSRTKIRAAGTVSSSTSQASSPVKNSCVRSRMVTQRASAHGPLQRSPHGLHGTKQSGQAVGSVLELDEELESLDEFDDEELDVHEELDEEDEDEVSDDVQVECSLATRADERSNVLIHSILKLHFIGHPFC